MLLIKLIKDKKGKNMKKQIIVLIALLTLGLSGYADEFDASSVKILDCSNEDIVRCKIINAVLIADANREFNEKHSLDIRKMNIFKVALRRDMLSAKRENGSFAYNSY